MKKQIRTSFVFTLFFTGVLGIVYPLLTAGVGSWLISSQRPYVLYQPQDGDEWFHGRPLEKIGPVTSLPTPVLNPSWLFGASSLSLTNPVLWNQVKLRCKAYGNSGEGLIPRELLFASASGYDPHISVQGALRQVPRIARTRSLDVTLLKKLVDQNTQTKTWGFIGTDMVNVIILNQLLAGSPKPFVR